MYDSIANLSVGGKAVDDALPRRKSLSGTYYTQDFSPHKGPFLNDLGVCWRCNKRVQPSNLKVPKKRQRTRIGLPHPDKVCIRLRSETAPGTEELRPERAADAHQQGWRSLPANAVGARCAAHSGSVWRRLRGTD